MRRQSFWGARYFDTAAVGDAAEIAQKVDGVFLS